MHVYRELDPHQISSCRHNLYFCLKLKKKKMSNSYVRWNNNVVTACFSLNIFYLEKKTCKIEKTQVILTYKVFSSLLWI